MPNHKAGYLRYKCKSCGALVRIGCSDVAKFMMNVVVSSGEKRFGTHNCSAKRVGLTELIGCEFNEKRGTRETL